MLGAFKLEPKQEVRFERSLNHYAKTITDKFRYLYSDEIKQELLGYVFENKTKFNKHRSSFPTYLHRCLEWGALKFIEKEAKRLSNEVTFSQLRIINSSEDDEKFDIDTIFGSYKDDVLLRLQRMELIETLSEFDRAYGEVYSLIISGKEPREIKRMLKIKKEEFNKILNKLNDVIFQFIDE